MRAEPAAVGLLRSAGEQSMKLGPTQLLVWLTPEFATSPGRRSLRRSSACAGGPGTAKPRMPGSPSSASTHSCPLSRASPLANCGGRWTRWTLPALPERPSGRLRRTTQGRPAGRDVTDREHGQFPGQPAHGQVAADALVPARGRPAAPSPLRRLQRHARHRLRAALPSRQ